MRGLLRRYSFVFSIALTLGASQSEEPRIEDVLQVAGTYVARFERDLAIVAEEEYAQQVVRDHRTLRSDVLFLKDDAFGWVEFRDVASRDGVGVRDRQERLIALFTKPNPDRLKQAQRVVAEGARFNLNPPGALINRTINLPLTAVRFLRTAAQPRSSFRIAGWNRQKGTVSLEFTERQRPRLIAMSDDGAVTGRFEIDAATGRVTSSRLVLQSGTTMATIAVQFALDAHVGMWLPLAMNEEYRGRFNGFVTGVAKYSNYRQFRVVASESVK